MLLHNVEGKRRVVEYYSKCTTLAESKYHSYELETLAVLNAIKHFRHYLTGRQFTVYTDCNSIKESQDKADKESGQCTPRVHRWWSFMQLFEFIVEYRKESQMAHVDCLSRNPVAVEVQPNTNKVVEVRVELATITHKWLVSEQQRDENISNIMSELNSDEMQR